MSARLTHPTSILILSFSKGLSEACGWTFSATMLLSQSIANVLMGPPQDHDWYVVQTVIWTIGSIISASTTCSRLFDGTYRFGSDATRKRIRQITAQYLASALITICVGNIPYYVQKSEVQHSRWAWILLFSLVLLSDYLCYRKIKHLVSDFAQPTAPTSQRA